MVSSQDSEYRWAVKEFRKANFGRSLYWSHICSMGSRSMRALAGPLWPSMHAPGESVRAENLNSLGSSSFPLGPKKTSIVAHEKSLGQSAVGSVQHEVGFKTEGVIPNHPRRSLKTELLSKLGDKPQSLRHVKQPRGRVDPVAVHFGRTPEGDISMGCVPPKSVLQSANVGAHRVRAHVTEAEGTNRNTPTQRRDLVGDGISDGIELDEEHTRPSVPLHACGVHCVFRVHAQIRPWALHQCKEFPRIEDTEACSTRKPRFVARRAETTRRKHPGQPTCAQHIEAGEAISEDGSGGCALSHSGQKRSGTPSEPP